MDAPECGFQGNVGFYGLGIRAGFYLQWASTLLTTIFLPRDVSFSRAINLLLQLALFSGLVMLTVTQPLHAIEPIIIIWLLFGALSSLTGDGISPFGTLSGNCRLVLYSAIAGYATWYWFVGLDTMIHTQCGTVAFFGDIHAYGKFRLFNKIASVLATVLCGSLMIWSVANWVSGRHTYSSVGDTTTQRVEIVLLLISTAVIVVSIAAIEYLMQKNNITNTDNVLSVGQLIPLLIGVMGFGKSVLDSLGRKAARVKREWFLFGYSLNGTPSFTTRGLQAKSRRGRSTHGRDSQNSFLLPEIEPSSALIIPTSHN